MSELTEKKQSHRFQPGQSGNPAGKPPGTRSKVLAELDRLGAEGAQAVLQAVLAAAQNGDIAAAALVLKRCWPEARGRAVRLSLPPISTAADTVAATGAVVDAVATGAISPEEGQAVAGVIEFQRRAIETNDLAARIEALERAPPMSLSTRLAKLERQTLPSATPEEIEQLVAGLLELQERAKREPWLQEHADALFAFIDSITDRRPPNR